MVTRLNAVRTLGGAGAKETLEALLYTYVFGPTCQRICGSGYQILKSVSKYPLGLKLYPRLCPRVQTQTRIRTQWVRYPRICGYSIPVAILKCGAAASAGAGMVVVLGLVC